MQPVKILYVATELPPLLEFSSLAALGLDIIKSSVNKKYEVQIIMPKFGLINERKGCINAIKRLHGVDIYIENHKISLIGKSGQLKGVGVHVYFIDNELVFKDPVVFDEKEGDLFGDDNEERLAFISKSYVEIVSQFGWVPDIVHCLGWEWGLIPMYSRGGAPDVLSLLSATKFVYTFGSNYLKDTLSSSFPAKAAFRNTPPEMLQSLVEHPNYEGFAALAKMHADVVTYSAAEDTPLPMETLAKYGVRSIPSGENFITAYQGIYDKLLEDKENYVDDSGLFSFSLL